MAHYAGRVPWTALPPAPRPAAPAFSYRAQCLSCDACREQQASIWRPPKRRAPAFGRRPRGVSACAAATAAPACSSEPDVRRPAGPGLQVARPALCAAAVLAWALASAGRGGAPLASLSVAAGHASQEGERSRKCYGATLLSRRCGVQGCMGIGPRSALNGWRPALCLSY